MDFELGSPSQFAVTLAVLKRLRASFRPPARQPLSPVSPGVLAGSCSSTSVLFSAGRALGAAVYSCKIKPKKHLRLDEKRQKVRVSDEVSIAAPARVFSKDKTRKKKRATGWAENHIFCCCRVAPVWLWKLNGGFVTYGCGRCGRNCRMLRLRCNKVPESPQQKKIGS